MKIDTVNKKLHFTHGEKIMDNKNVPTSRSLFQTFNDETTFHGVRFVFGRDRPFYKRLMWAVLVCACLTFLIIEVSDRFSHFMGSPVTVNIVSRHKDSIVFPAVTICNQNAFRRTLAIQNDHYNILAHLYNDINYSFKALSEQEKDVSLQDLFTKNAHQKEDMIASCTWKGQPCTHQNFTSILTKYGQCYTFNGDLKNPQTIESPGVRNGLELLINAEEYDYMVGPHSGGGIKVLLHRQEEFPFPSEYGHELPTGRHGFMDVQISVTKMLPFPYGYCKDIPGQFLNHYSISKEACALACEADFIKERCGCMDYYLPETNSSDRMCKVRDYHCVTEATMQFQAANNPRCNCYTPCTRMRYNPTMSYGSISDFSRNLLLNTSSKHLQQRYLSSRETAFRFEEGFYDVRYIYEDLIHHQLPEFYKMISQLEKLDSTFERCSKEVYKFEDAHLSKLIANLRGTHYIFRFYPDIIKLIERGPFGISDDHIVEFLFSIESQLIVIKMSHDRDEKKSYFKMILNTLNEKISFGENLTYVDKWMDILLRSYPNIWFRDLESLVNDQRDLLMMNTLQGSVYQRDIPVDKSTLKSTIEKCIKMLNRYKDIVQDFKKTGNLNVLDVNNTATALRNYVIQYNAEVKNVKTWWADDLSVNLFHLAQVLESLKNAHQMIMDNLDRTCISVKYVKKIRRTSEFLSMCTEKLKEYIDGEQEKMTSICNYFLMRDMEYFIEGLRTFATNTFSELRTEMLGPECLHTLLQSYQTVILWYLQIGKHLTRTSVDYCYRNRNAMMSVTQNVNINASIWYDVMSNINKLVHHSQKFSESVKIDSNFYKNNFLRLSILFHDLDYDEMTQQKAYDVYAFLGDLGGAMGLFVGASVMSVFELADFAMTVVNKFFRRRKPQVKVVEVKECDS